MDRILYKEANGDLTCRARDFDKVFQTLYAYEELEMTPEDIEQTMLRFSSFLMEMTGGRMSKTNYTVQAMVAEANGYFERVCDECADRQELAEIKKELEKVKAERDAIVAYIKKGGCGCTLCKHCACDPDDDPCASCFTGQNYPKWEWGGE